MLLQAIKRIFSKRNIVIFVIIVWVAFSVWYVARDQWQRFQYNQVQTSYQQGISDTIKLLISQAEKCVPVPVQNGDKKIEVQMVNCSSQQVAPQKEIVAPTPKP